ncbi:MAG: FAD-dependent oxidoreductase [Frankiales bacterium]|nr:FAD-dependent oxidoreductase [Frankiales bacterium]
MTRSRSVPVLIIGAGGAGLRAALAAHEAGVEVLVLTKRARRDAHTSLAAGGVNAALGSRDPDDSPEWHFKDTYEEGYALADAEAVEILVSEAPARVRELAQWGAPFARLDSGAIDQRFFGAHRYRRTCFAGDWTGRAIIDVLYSRVAAAGIEVCDDQYVAELLVDPDTGRCFGALTFDLATGEHTAFLADAVVLAAGGHTRLWRRSSSRRDENYGESMSLAARAGASLADMELVQFHPSGMTWPENVAGTLVTEAVRGEGGLLTNADGERFMSRYDPERMELSTRDRVALAAYREIRAGRGGPNGGVFLDVSHVSKERILSRLPRMYRQMIEHQMLDISTTPMEISPTAHYSMGGVVVSSEDSTTGVPGLFAAGEAAAGVHGANRLGGNSLAEILVFGARAGSSAAAEALGLEVARRPRAVIAAASEALAARVRPGPELARVVQRDLRDLLWEYCGVERDAAGLTTALAGLDQLDARAERVDVRVDSEGWVDLAQLCDLRAGLLAARATVLGALARTETRGAHVRSDFPDLDPAQRVSRVFTGADLVVSVVVRPTPSERFSAVLAAEPLPLVPGRLLE